MKYGWRKISAILLTCMVLLAVSVAQETTGSVQGLVKDSSGAVVPNAAVEVSGPSLLGVKKANTDSGGFYRVTNLPPGSYTITVTATGFTAAKRSNLVVAPGRTESVDISIAVGGSTETVEVSAEAQLVQPTESKAQVNISSEVIASIPKGRSYQSLIAFAPGARAEPLQGSGAGNPGFQIDGASNGENAYLVEGMDTTGIQTGRSGVNVPFEFIQEVQIKSSGFEAEHGGALGGVVNVIQKRGSNTWHGQVVTHWRSDRLDANDSPFLRLAPSGTLPTKGNRPAEYYQPKEDKWNVLEPGFEVGGALVKDRLWLFSSYIPRWDTNTRTVRFTAVPGAQPISTQSYRNTDTQHNALNRLDLRISDAIRVFGAWQYGFRRNIGNQRPGADAENEAALAVSNPLTNNVPTPTAQLTPNPSATTPPTQYPQDAGFVAPNSVYTTGADITLGSNAVATTRFGYWFSNFADRGKPSGVNYTYGFGTRGVTDLAGNDIEPQVAPAFQQSSGFTSLGSSVFANQNTFFDAYKRTSFSQDLSYFRRTSFGTHNFKFGYGFNKLSNDVFLKYNDSRVFTFWGLGWGSTILPSFQANCDAIDAQNMATYGNVGDGCQGSHGFFIVRDFQTTGKVSTFNHSLYVQDAWSVGGGLTLNLGLRFDKEKVPAYNNAPAIEFGFGDKIAPRLGAAYDVLRNGKWKVYGSWGWFYDIMKFEMPRGSFGGDYWHDCVFALDTPNLAAIVPVRNAAGTNCPGVGAPNSFGANARFIEEVDWRVNANAPSALAGFPFGLAKDIKPMRQTEFVIGSDYALASNLGLEVRYARKRLDRTIEDIGFESPAGEFYWIGNPGENAEVNATYRTFCASCNALPKAKRNYDGIEFRLIKQASKNWYGTVSYTYSRLYGNYSGLTSTDESGRASPNVNRFFDLPHMSFNSDGTPQEGLLPTDRPHSFKGFGYYNLKWFGMETQIGASQLWYSGTPLSTKVGLVSSQSAEAFVEGRGNFQEVTQNPTTGLLTRGTLHKGLRTEMFEQTDILLTHEIKVSKSNENLRLGFEFNVVNVFNQNNTLRTTQNALATSSPYLNNVNLTEATTTGYDWVAKFNSAGLARRLSTAYGKPDLFQAPRNVRLAMRFRF